jgi:hypothetical protein
MDLEKIDKIVELLHDPELDVGTEILYTYETELHGQKVLVTRYESALPKWIKSRAEQKRKWRNKQ